MEATGGWVIGVLFDAWRSADHVAGTGGGSDGLGGYLGAHILDQLDANDREFLISTAVLQEVSVESAVALGIDDAAGRLASLQPAAIPAQWSAESADDALPFTVSGVSARAARPARERGGARAARGPRTAAGAPAVFMKRRSRSCWRAGALTDAYTSAKRAILGVIGRLDFDVADRWIQALSPVVPVGEVGFAEAQLMLAIARDDQRHGTRIADELAALGLRDQLVATSERAAALMAWCYLLAGRIDEVHAVLDAAPAGPNVNVVRYSLTLVEPGSGPPRPEPTGGLLDGMLYGIDYFRGRLRELTERSAVAVDENGHGHGPHWCAARRRTHRRSAAAV